MEDHLDMPPGVIRVSLSTDEEDDDLLAITPRGAAPEKTSEGLLRVDGNSSYLRNFADSITAGGAGRSCSKRRFAPPSDSEDLGHHHEQEWGEAEQIKTNETEQQEAWNTKGSEEVEEEDEEQQDKEEEQEEEEERGEEEVEEEQEEEEEEEVEEEEEKEEEEQEEEEEEEEGEEEEEEEAEEEEEEEEEWKKEESYGQARFTKPIWQQQLPLAVPSKKRMITPVTCPSKKIVRPSTSPAVPSRGLEMWIEISDDEDEEEEAMVVTTDPYL